MLDIIKEIIEEKRINNKSPAFALYSEVMNEMMGKGHKPEEVKAMLHKLRSNGLIEAGHCINNIWIKTTNDNGKSK